jgi:hypothetical protein
MLLAISKSWATQIGESGLIPSWEVLHEEMTSGDYSHLVHTMDKYFGHFVTFTNAKQAGVKNE